MEKIKIKKFYIIVENKKGKEYAELVGVDKELNEYRLENKVFIGGEYHRVKTDIIKTQHSLKDKINKGL